MKYYAYGSNMNAERMKERKINVSQRTHANLKGYDLKFNKVAYDNAKEGYANIVPDEKAIVEGVLYDISDSDLPRLDKYEGYPSHYYRVKVKVQLGDGQEVEAITYIAQPDKVTEGLRPMKGYLNHLLAARDILSESYFRRLEAWETLD